MKELTVDAAVESIGPATEFVNAYLELYDCPMKVQLQLNVAMDEILSNIAHYAYPSSTGAVTIRVEMLQAPSSVSITFLDRGIPFDPLQTAVPDTTLPAEEREIGGLGIYLVKKTMDAVTYEYKDGQNVLQICKNL